MATTSIAPAPPTGPQPESGPAGRLLEAVRSSVVSRFKALCDWIWPPQTDECPLCHEAFTKDILSKPSQAAMSAAQAERCHGCSITGLVLRLLYPILDGKWGSGLIFSSMTLSTAGGRSRIDLFVEDKRRDRSESLEIFKSTSEPSYVTRWFDRLRAICGLPRQIGPLPQYLREAFEQNPISGYTGSPEAFETAFSWFEKCNASHNACGNDAESPVLPTRIIDFSSKENLRLVDGQGARGQYICLSHRWLSDKEVPRCMRDNLAQLKQHIRWDSLTRTFQHAIIFAQAFSKWHHKTFPGREPIRYIWIDSLCIIQDSSEDWEREAGQMCSVYENATLTIAAAVGGNGCFSVAEQFFKGFEITNPRHRNMRSFMRMPLPHFGLGNISVLEREQILKDPEADSLNLLSRGWVLQERLLSKRFLIFGPHELMWECLEGIDCECRYLTNQSAANTLDILDRNELREAASLYWRNAYDGYQKDNPNNPVMESPMKIAHFKSLAQPTTSGNQGALAHSQLWWHRIVEVYSRTSLTKASDRLPALAGLAAQFSRLTGYQDYYAGIWAGMFLESLTWYVETTEIEEKPQKSLRGQQINASATAPDPQIAIPSWSWVSCGRPVQFSNRGVDPTKFHANINATVYAALSPDNPFGNCSRATLLLSGPVCWGIRESLWDKSADSLVPKGTYYPDKGTCSQPAELHHKYRHLRHDRYILVSCVGPQDSYEEKISPGWLLLHLGPTNEHSTSFRRLGLLLIEAPTEKNWECDDATDNVLRACFTNRTKEVLQLV